MKNAVIERSESKNFSILRKYLSIPLSLTV